MKNSEVRQLTDKEIMERIENVKSDLVRLKINHAVSPLDNPMKIREAKKNIARLSTELTRRKKEKSIES